MPCKILLPLLLLGFFSNLIEATPQAAPSNAVTNSSTLLNYAVIVFPGFQALDVFGPLDILNMHSFRNRINLHIIAASLDPVSTKPLAMNGSGSDFGQSIVPTHTFAQPPPEIDVLIVPGGVGTRNTNMTAPISTFVQETYPRVKYLMSVCTGAAILAKSGVLDGRKATTNKISFNWVTTQGPNVEWVYRARWVVDGNIWTSSGIAAGIDAMYGFIGAVYGEDVSTDLAFRSEYVRNTDPNNDPFAVDPNLARRSAKL